MNRGQLIRNRQGVTLIEVLFAIGIVIIGLLGIVSLIPVAGAKVRSGIEIDRMSVIGRGAVRAVETYGMNNVDNLLYYDFRNTPQFVPYNPTNKANNQAIGNLPSIRTSFDDGSGSLNFRESFCIDPRFMAYHFDATTISLDHVVFPYVHVANPASSVNNPNTHVPRMRRISLLNVPYNANNFPTGVSLTASGFMQSPQAEYWFVSRDDLKLDIPTDDTLDPVSVFGPDDRRRQFAGDLSWFVTFTPVMQSWAMGGTLATRPLGGPIRGVLDERSDRYLMSVVVFRKRDPAFILDAKNERIVSVQNFWSGGFGGGEVTLFSPTKEALNVREDEWIMLAANSSAGEMFRWYRVLASDAEPRPQANPQGWVMDVSLQGPDWDRPEWLGAATGTNLNYQTYAVLMEGILGVFEKTIHLELVSDWKL